MSIKPGDVMVADLNKEDQKIVFSLKPAVEALKQ